MQRRNPKCAWPMLLAALVYLSICLVFSDTAGLQYDEANSFWAAANAVDGLADPCQDARSLRLGERCWPLMSLPYVGRAKDYFLMPIFRVTGVGVQAARMGAALLALLGIAGVWSFLRRARGPTAAGIAALLLAVHPSYIDIPLFDSGDIAFSLGALGSILLAASALIGRRSHARVFLLGLLVGLAVWGRLNFSWLVLSAAVGSALVFWRTLPLVLPYLATFAGGVLAGATPLLIYLFRNGSELAHYVSRASSSKAFSFRLPTSLFLFRDVLLADSEHRAIWGGTALPGWSTALAALAVSFAVLWCLFAGKHRVGTAIAASFLLLLLIYVTSSLPIAQHHLVVLVPLAAMSVGIFAADLSARSRRARPALMLAGALYAVGALSIDAGAALGLRRTGGLGEWSSRIEELAGILEREGGARPVYALDWGFKIPLELLSGGRLRCDELFWNATDLAAGDGRSWAQVIAEGGAFISYADPDLHLPLSTLRFRAALDCSNREYRTILVSERDPHRDYARVWLVEPSEAPPGADAERCASPPATLFFARPNPIAVGGGDELGETTLFFTTRASRFTEIHVGAPDGPILAVFDAVNSGVATTGRWVRDGMVFFLQDVSDGKPRSPAHTLAAVEVSVVPR